MVSIGSLNEKEAEHYLREMNLGNKIPEIFERNVEQLFSKKDLPRRMMNWEEIKEIHKSNFWIGGHTANHKILTFLNSIQQEFEINDSIETVRNQLNEKPITFAYPNGLYDQDTLEKLRKVIREHFALQLCLELHNKTK